MFGVRNRTEESRGRSRFKTAMAAKVACTRAHVALMALGVPVSDASFDMVFVDGLASSFQSRLTGEKHTCICCYVHRVMYCTRLEQEHRSFLARGQTLCRPIFVFVLSFEHNPPVTHHECVYIIADHTVTKCELLTWPIRLLMPTRASFAQHAQRHGRFRPIRPHQRHPRVVVYAFSYNSTDITDIPESSVLQRHLSRTLSEYTVCRLQPAK
jgi:hypothetical protein